MQKVVRKVKHFLQNKIILSTSIDNMSAIYIFIWSNYNNISYDLGWNKVRLQDKIFLLFEQPNYKALSKRIKDKGFFYKL